MKSAPGTILLLVIVASVYAGLVCVPLIGVARKMGYSAPIGLLALVPGANIALAWFLALSEWPMEKELKRLSKARS